MKEELRPLVLYRLDQADESLDSAKLLVDHKKYRPSVSRSYYAMFYAVLALLASGEQRPSKHSGVIALFDREFVKKGLFDEDLSRWFHEAFDLRQRADYREMFTVSEDRADRLLRNACAFVERVKGQILPTIAEEEAP